MADSIYLRYVSIADATTILEWENNEEWNSSGIHYSIYDIMQLIHELQDIERGKQARWMICDTDSDKAMGVVDLTEIDMKESEASVGVFIPDHSDRRKGHASAALLMLEDKAQEIGVQRLKATIALDNVKSQALFLKSGFTKIGETDKAYVNEGDYIKALIFEKCFEK